MNCIHKTFLKMQPVNTKEFHQEQQQTNNKTAHRIDGLKVLKELLVYKGRGIINNNTIPLQMLEDKALQLYELKQNASNRLYVYIQLVKFYKERNMLDGKLIRLTDAVYERINKL